MYAHKNKKASSSQTLSLLGEPPFYRWRRLISNMPFFTILFREKMYNISRLSCQALRLAFGVPNDFGQLGMSTEPNTFYRNPMKPPCVHQHPPIHTCRPAGALGVI